MTISANTPDEWVITIPCPRMVDGHGTKFVACDADVEVMLTGEATYTVPATCVGCEATYTDDERAALRESAKDAWHNYEPTEAELEQWNNAESGGESPSYRMDMINAGRGHLLRE